MHVMAEREISKITVLTPCLMLTPSFLARTLFLDLVTAQKGPRL